MRNEAVGPVYGIEDLSAARETFKARAMPPERPRCASVQSSTIQVGAWSLARSRPRTSRSTPASVSRPATDGLSSR